MPEEKYHRRAQDRGKTCGASSQGGVQQFLLYEFHLDLPFLSGAYRTTFQ